MYRRIMMPMLIFLFFMGMLSGCTRFATSGKMMDRIEKMGKPGITEQAFNKAVPIARLVEQGGSKKVYLVAFGEPCFVCGSGKAFLRSFEPYATLFTFENGKLNSFERIRSGS